MKRVLVFGMTDNPGGVESFLMAHYREIDRSTLQFDFLCNNKTVAYEDEIQALGGEVFKICARSENPVLYKKELNRFFKNNAHKYAAIWVNVCSLANIDYLKAAKKYKIKTRIIHSHNSQNMDSALRGVLHKINRVFIKLYATSFWACSMSAAKWFYSDSIISSDRFKILANAVDCDKFDFSKTAREEVRSELNLQDKLVLGNVGRLHSQKNQGFLLETFKEVLSKNQNSVLLIVGQGEDEHKLKDKAKDLGVSDKVMFLGVRSDVNRLFSAMDAFVLPSLYEGLAIVLVEAQASGLVCFASDSVTKEAKITELLNFIPLESGKESFAKSILSYDYGALRHGRKAELTEKGFNVKVSSQYIMNFFKEV